jgi:hypothetical protein
MRKPEYSNAERKALIEFSRLRGMSDVEILRLVITGVRGIDARKRLIIQWAELMGIEASEALRIARRGGLVLTARMPRLPDEKI